MNATAKKFIALLVPTLPVLETIDLVNLIIHLFYNFIKLFIAATALRIGNEERMGAIAVQFGQESGMAPLVPTS
jgi:uncharacterized membrane protein